jgi:hypothetical protein
LRDGSIPLLSKEGRLRHNKKIPFHTGADGVVSKRLWRHSLPVSAPINAGLRQQLAQGLSRRYVQFETKERCGCTICKANPIMVDISSTRLNDLHHYAFSATMHSKNRYDNMVVQVEVRFASLKWCITQSELPNDACRMPLCSQNFDEPSRKKHSIVFWYTHRLRPPPTQPDVKCGGPSIQRYYLRGAT